MKLTAAGDLEPKGDDDILFRKRLIEAGLFQPTTQLPARFGLRLRRGSSGRIIRTWIIQYRQHGRAPRMVIGPADVVTAAQALAKAKTLLAQVALGEDPQAEKAERREKDALTLRAVIKEFLAQKTQVKPGTLRMLRSYLEGPLYLKPLHGNPIDRITRKDIAARLLAVSKASGTPTALAFRSALSTFFAWAVAMGLVEHNPVVGAFKPKAPASRERVLSDAELAEMWKSLEDDDYGKVVKLLILTGCRRSEIGGMAWSEFDFDKGRWSLPAERSKNGKAHTLPLTPLMLDIIEAIPRRDRFDILFGYKHGFTGWSIGKHALDKRLGLPAWVHHDIRRSVATGMADIGIQPHIIEEILNHRSGHRRGIAATYNRSSYEREVRDAMLRWSTHVAEIVDGTAERKVVTLDQRRVAGHTS